MLTLGVLVFLTVLEVQGGCSPWSKVFWRMLKGPYCLIKIVHQLARNLGPWPFDEHFEKYCA